MARKVRGSVDIDPQVMAMWASTASCAGDTKP